MSLSLLAQYVYLLLDAEALGLGAEPIFDNAAELDALPAPSERFYSWRRDGLRGALVGDEARPSLVWEDEHGRVFQGPALSLAEYAAIISAIESPL